MDFVTEDMLCKVFRPGDGKALAHGTQADEKNVQGLLQYEQNLKVVFAYL